MSKITTARNRKPAPDVAAFEAFLLDNRDSMEAMAARVLWGPRGARLSADRNLPTDVVSDAVLDALKGWSNYDPSYPIRSWFIRILVNRCLMTMRSWYHRNVRTETDAVRWGDEDANSPIENGSLSRAGEGGAAPEVDAIVMRIALGRMDAIDREALLMNLHAGESGKDIAAMMGIPVAEAYQRIGAARASFRAAYEAATEDSCLTN